MKRDRLPRLLLPVILFGFISPLPANPATADAALQADLERIVQRAYADNEPGAAVMVVRDGQTLYRGARGLANVELSVPMRPEHVFRIGSITKQFTAAAILLLAEQGKLQLSDPITKYLPDYPVQGHTVTIQHLLSHTSGIANYTEQPTWFRTIRNDVTVQQLMQVFQDKPFDFAPGERWKYDNSGYVLLGAIIEKISGQPYSDFMRTQLFEPLGMMHTGYEDTARITPLRTPGYTRNGERWLNADYLSMSQPYAAGALTSTVDDLAIWNAVMASGGLLEASSWQRATSSFVLRDGTPTRYGAGWIMGRVGPVATIEHGGGINGFNAYVLRAPRQNVFVAVLTNAMSPRSAPQQVAVELASRALGVSLDAPEVPMAASRLDEYAGNYLLDGARSITVLRDGDRLYAQEGAAPRVELVPIGTDLFEERGQHAHYAFHREKRRVAMLEIEPRILVSQRARRASASR